VKGDSRAPANPDRPRGPAPPPPPGIGADDLAERPLERAWTLPAALYTEPAAHAFEREAIFARCWHLAGRAGAVADPGCHLVAEVAGRPLIVVRGRDGALRGFFNVCKHRGGPLALENGCASRLQCRYHGWTYELDGRLRAASEMREAEDFNSADVRLDAVHAGQWEGLVFAAARDPGVTLETLLGGIREEIAPASLPHMAFHTRVNYEMGCNWKAYVDNYLEGYHLPHVHPGLNRLLDYRSYTTTTAAWYSYQTSPLDRGEGPYGEGQAHYYFVWPNLMLNVLPGRLQTNVVIPLGPDRCRVVFDYYYADTESAAARRMIAEDLAFSDEVQQEDIAICERVQQGLASGAYRAGRLSPKREAGVHHFQNLVRAAYRRAL